MEYTKWIMCFWKIAILKPRFPTHYRHFISLIPLWRVEPSVFGSQKQAILVFKMFLGRVPVGKFSENWKKIPQILPHYFLIEEKDSLFNPPNHIHQTD